MALSKVVCYSFSLRDIINAGPAGHLRIVAPFQQAGISIIPGLKDGQIILDHIADVDAIVIQREFPGIFGQYQSVVRRARGEGKPIIYEIDDLLWFLPERHPNRIAHDYASVLLPMFEGLTEADLVTVSAPMLKEVLAEYNQNIAVLPNYFDDNLWRLNPPTPTHYTHQALTIGFMGTNSHEPDLEYILPVLLKLVNRYRHKIRFHFWGIQPPSDLSSVSYVEWTPFPINSSYRDFASFFQTQSADIFIAPLVDNLFNRCKSSVKFFEYSALGVPGVYSFLEPYREVVKHGHNGLLASSLDEWEDCLIQLIEDDELRLQLARNAQDSIREHWLLTENAFRWKEAFEDLSSASRQKAPIYNQVFQSVNTQLFDAFTEKDNRIRELSAQLTEKEQILQALTAKVAEREYELSEIYHSKAWKIITITRRMLTVLFPPGSWRLKMLKKSLMFVKPLMIWETIRVQKDLSLIRSSDLWDEAWYLAHNPDVKRKNIDAARHYLLVGGFEGRDPSPGFSSSWYLENYKDVKAAKINPLLHYLRYGNHEGRTPNPVKVRAQRQESKPIISAPDQVTVFTICARNFTAYAKTLFDSIHQHHPNAECYVFLCDEFDAEYKNQGFTFNVVSLAELEISQLSEMIQRYNITELNTSIKPFAFLYLFKKGRQKVIYFDPDILVVSPLVEVLGEFEKGAECVLTPHIVEPAENVEMSDVRFLQYGIYNLGFIGLQNTPQVVRIVEWWARKLVDQCIIDLEKGLFVDQKWADLFPAFLERTVILRHPGYNVAYWNIHQRRIELVDGIWLSNKHPLRFVHFSGYRPGDYYFTRRIGGVTRDTIGGLKLLVEEYDKKLFSNGHEYYSTIPYAFNWNGQTGINLHTPAPLYAASDTMSKPLESTKTDLFHRLLRKLKTIRSLIVISVTRAEGWIPLLIKLARVFKRDGLDGLLIRYRAIRGSYMYITQNVASGGMTKNLQGSQLGKWVPRLLFIDWSTPRPDQDAGSVSAYHILKILVESGYDVTFIPSDLQYLGHYTDDLRNLGIRCLHREEIISVKNHLQKEGENYQFIWLCRSPIANLYISDICKYASQAKIILDTVDLHYLREMRLAEVDGDPEKMQIAEQTKNSELNLFRQCDVVILFSTKEYEILKSELPDVDLRVVPLVFVDPIFDSPPFENREGLMFIGGFRHLPNVDAVIYFCKEILPLIRRDLPTVEFHIIGSSPPAEILALAEIPGVVVHGYVKDITSVFRKCKLSVAPLRYGAGIKGKIATSLAHGVPVVATSIAAEGMQLNPGEHLLVADDPREFAEAITRLYTSKELWSLHSVEGRKQALQVYSPFALRQQIASMLQEVNPLHKDIELYTLRSYEEYDLLKQIIGEHIHRRRSIELGLIDHSQPSFSINGFCAVCGQESTFITSFVYSYEVTGDNKPIPNWREHLGCTNCGFQNRIRAAIHLFYQLLRPHPNARIYLTEQVTPLYEWMKKRHPNLTGSEYLGDSVLLGQESDGVRNEDLTRLTFEDDSFDYILSFDVMEHVGDDIAAFREVYRCLKPGGVFMFSAPFLKDRTEKLVRARMQSDGSIEHLMPPEYHGNPLDQDEGSLCFRYFAWDLIGDLRNIGFDNIRILNYWSRDFAYLGVEQFIFLATKNL